MTKRIFLLLIISISLASFTDKSENIKVKPEFLSIQNNWIDSVFESLSIEERIAQLFIISAYSNKDSKHVQYISDLVGKYNVGGVIFFQGGPYRQTNLINKYQDLAKTPLLIGQDAEWGIGMRLDSTIDFPRQMMLGAIQNNSLIYEFGKDVALQCKNVGVHINFAPVVDINNNPNNPVINSRSFGEEVENVTMKGYEYMKGMQENGILTSAKHFPGHGDTDADSHYTLPLIKHSKKRMKKVELRPYNYLIDNGLSGIMVAHLNIPAYEKDSIRATTLSSVVVNDLLKKKMKFEGLIYTDALNMKGVADYYPPGRIEIEALKAGNDVLLFPIDVEIGIDSLKSALDRGEITEERINESCKKILKAKYWAGLDNFQVIDNSKINVELNTENRLHLKRKLIEHAVTLVEGADVLPLKSLDTLNIASISIGDGSITKFQETLKLYSIVDDFQISKNADKKEFQELATKLSDYNLIIFGIHETNEYPSKKFGITKNSIDFIHQIAEDKNVVLDLFANPYSLAYFEQIKAKAIIMSYEDDIDIQDLSAQMIFGGIQSRGKLPITASERFKVGNGIVQKKKSD